MSKCKSTKNGWKKLLKLITSFNFRAQFDNEKLIQFVNIDLLFKISGNTE